MTAKHSRLILCAFFVQTLLAVGFSSPVSARGREGYAVKPTFVDNGDVIDTAAYTVGTTTPVQILVSTATQAMNYRELMFQNASTSTYRVYIGTHSAVSASSGARWFIPAGGTWTTKCKASLWAIYESGAAGTLQVLTEFERDSQDSSVTGR